MQSSGRHGFEIVHAYRSSARIGPAGAVVDPERHVLQTAFAAERTGKSTGQLDMDYAVETVAIGSSPMHVSCS